MLGSRGTRAAAPGGAGSDAGPRLSGAGARRHRGVPGIPDPLLSRLQAECGADLSRAAERAGGAPLGRRGQREHRIHRARPGGPAGADDLGRRGGRVADSGAVRSLEYRTRLTSTVAIELGWFVLGSMRVERDFQYAGRHRSRSGAAVLGGGGVAAGRGRRRLAGGERGASSGAPQPRTLGVLRAPAPAVHHRRRAMGPAGACRVERPSLDGRNRLVLELRDRPGDRSAARRRGPSRSGARARPTRRCTSPCGSPPTPRRSRRSAATRSSIAAFLAFLAGAAAATDTPGGSRPRRLERQVRGVELLSTREKLMAGLPNFATYFGRDMMMTALMMRPIWRRRCRST